MNSDVLVIILARGGSKAIPLKNLAKVGGISLIRRCCLVALKLNVKEIIVSTDSIEIADEVSDLNLSIFKRSETHATDSSTSEDSILEVLSKIQHDEFKILVFIQPTAPFVNFLDILLAIQQVRLNPTDTYFSAVEDNKFVWTKSNKAWLPNGFDINNRPPRQELPKSALETGAFWVMHKRNFLENKSRYCGTPKPLVVEKMFSYEIDDFEDLILANEIAPRIDAQLKHISSKN
jgi:CMP-N-acetylneuraminic acid synthetase